MSETWREKAWRIGRKMMAALLRWTIRLALWAAPLAFAPFVESAFVHFWYGGLFLTAAVRNVVKAEPWLGPSFPPTSYVVSRFLFPFLVILGIWQLSDGWNDLTQDLFEQRF